jgi:hypothetical protein
MGAAHYRCGLRLSIYKGGFARRPLRGEAAHSPTTTRRAARASTGGFARRPLRGEATHSPTTARRAARDATGGFARRPLRGEATHSPTTAWRRAGFNGRLCPPPSARRSRAFTHHRAPRRAGFPRPRYPLWPAAMQERRSGARVPDVAQFH